MGIFSHFMNLRAVTFELAEELAGREIIARHPTGLCVVMDLYFWGGNSRRPCGDHRLRTSSSL